MNALTTVSGGLLA